MKIKNHTNAFCSVKTSEGTIVIDPWITDGIYEGSWYTHPRPQNYLEPLRSARACLISHIHADHFDLNALAQLPSDASIVLPDLYPNRQVAQRQLPRQVFDRVSFVVPEVVFSCVGTTAVFIPPMNRYGHVVDRYTDEDDDVAAIDTGIILEEDDGKVVFLADNFPYNLKSARSALQRMVGATAVFFPYNAAADDYPTCHDNLTLDEKKRAAERRNQIRVKHLKHAFSYLKPKLTVPYSSDFMVAGPRAVEFIQVQPPTFLDKRVCADHIELITGITCRALYETDELQVNGQNWKTSIQGRADLDHISVAKSLRVLSVAEYPSVSENVLEGCFHDACQHMLSRMKVPSAWCFELETTDTGYVFGIDLATGKQYTPDQLPKNNTVRCRTTSGYAHALLTFKIHWDNAMIAYHLSWYRSPDTYDVGLYKALNYLHVPVRKP